MCSAKADGVSPEGSRVHCTARNISGTLAIWSVVPSMTTGTRNGLSSAMWWVRSDRELPLPAEVPFHSRRRVFAEITGKNRAQSWICRRIS